MPSPTEVRKTRRKNTHAHVSADPLHPKWRAFCPRCAEGGHWLPSRLDALTDLELHEQSRMHLFWTGTDPAPESWAEVPGRWRDK